jgi:type IV pilus assembly protein PilW
VLRFDAQRGLTMVELLVSMTLGVIILGALASVYVAAKQAYRFQDTAGRITEDGNYALDAIARHIRMAGFSGCVGLTKTVVGSTTTYAPVSALSSADPNGISGPNPLKTVETSSTDAAAQPFTTTTFIRGFNSTPSTMFASGSAPTVPTGTVANALFVSGGGMNTVGLSSAMASSSAALSFGGTDPYGWASKGAGNFIVSDCSASAVFKGAVSVTAGIYGLSHTVADGNSGTDLAGGTLFDTKASISPLEWRFFYLGTRAGATTPSLYVVVFDGFSRASAIELVSNVEAMSILYGENTANDGSGNPTMQIDAWRSSASSVTDWSRIVAVRVGLMMVSSDSKPDSGEMMPPVPTLLGAAYTLPTGALTSLLRKEFSTTIVLRNRAPVR